MPVTTASPSNRDHGGAPPDGVAGPLIITGFHRSGTSMLASMLSAAGLDLGEKLLPASLGNPEGHIEDPRVLALHERALIDRGLNWRATISSAVDVGLPLENEFRRFVAERAAAGADWGFKDPRACLFLPFWRRIAPGSRVVAMYRHYWECSESLLVRHSRALAYDGKSTPHIEFWLDPSLATRMWLSYNRALMADAAVHPGAFMPISHSALLLGLHAVREVKTRFDMNLAADAVAGVIKPAHVNAGRRQAFEFPSAVLEELDGAWNALQALADHACRAAPAAGRPPPLRPDSLAAAQERLASLCRERARKNPPSTAGRNASATRRILGEARLLERSGNLRETERVITSGLEALPGNWELLLRRARVLARLGETRRSIECRWQAYARRFEERDQTPRLLEAAATVPDPRARLDLTERMAFHVQALPAAALAAS